MAFRRAFATFAALRPGGVRTPAFAPGQRPQASSSGNSARTSGAVPGAQRARRRGHGRQAACACGREAQVSESLPEVRTQKSTCPTSLELSPAASFTSFPVAMYVRAVSKDRGPGRRQPKPAGAEAGMQPAEFRRRLFPDREEYGHRRRRTRRRESAARSQLPPGDYTLPCRAARAPAQGQESRPAEDGRVHASR